MSATSEPNKWHFLRTAATAPAGAAKVQAVIVHSQKGYSGGAVYWDDMDLSMVVGPKSNYGLGTRNVATGDLDGDGKGEVIFMKGAILMILKLAYGYMKLTVPIRFL